MKKFLNFLDKYFEETILVILLGCICCVMMLQVIMRYFVGASLTWAEEITRYCFVYSGFLSAGYCARNGLGLRVDAIVVLLPKFVQRGLDFLNNVFLLIFYGFFFMKSLDLIKVSVASGATSTALQIPMTAVYFSLVLGFGLAVIRMIQTIILSLINMKTSNLVMKKGGTN